MGVHGSIYMEIGYEFSQRWWKIVWSGRRDGEDISDPGEMVRPGGEGQAVRLG